MKHVVHQLERRSAHLRLWVVPLVAALLMVGLAAPMLASVVANANRPMDTVGMIFGAETVDGYQQIYYERDGVKQFITSAAENHAQPVGAGEYIAWVTTRNGAGQIELYHVPSQSVTKITHDSTNQNPVVSTEGRVVWERWMGDRWQVWLFSGTAVRQLTDGDVAVRPDIEGDQVVLARQDDSGAWRAERLNLADDTVQVVGEGEAAMYPRLTNGEAVFATGL